MLLKTMKLRAKLQTPHDITIQIMDPSFKTTPPMSRKSQFQDINFITKERKESSKNWVIKIMQIYKKRAHTKHNKEKDNPFRRKMCKRVKYLQGCITVTTSLSLSLNVELYLWWLYFIFFPGFS